MTNTKKPKWLTKGALLEKLKDLKDDDIIRLQAEWPDGTTSNHRVLDVVLTLSKGGGYPRSFADLTFAANEVIELE